MAHWHIKGISTFLLFFSIDIFRQVTPIMPDKLRPTEPIQSSDGTPVDAVQDLGSVPPVDRAGTMYTGT